MTTLKPLAIVALVAFALPGTALAQSSVSRDDALRIAAQEGLVSIEEVERDDGDWEIEGWDNDGREMELEIDGGNGRILDRDRDD